ncbi:thioesterase family protein [Chloroflexi bacterium TSY]|nr:thioesterase family protein [Chloroflexi bacterium TSY]
MHSKLLTLLETTVQPEWLDYNDHMTEGYYAVAFGFATDAVLFHIGLEEHKAKTGCTFYTAQTMITFVQELKLGDPLKFTTQLLGADRKRIHMFHQMLHKEKGYLAATVETMLLHFDQKLGEVVPMPDTIYQNVEPIAKAHAELPVPETAGLGVRSVKK